MFGNRSYVLAGASIALALLSLPAAGGSRYDGAWSMTAVTTNGHCGEIPVGMVITRGRIHATSGSFAFYPIQLSGSVSGSGGASIKAVSGPRIALGSGRFHGTEAKGRWHGRGPSGLCSGVWTATRG